MYINEYIYLVITNAIKDSKVTVYKRLIRPVLGQASPVWNPCTRYYIGQLQSVQ